VGVDSNYCYLVYLWLNSIDDNGAYHWIYHEGTIRPAVSVSTWYIKYYLMIFTVH